MSIMADKQICTGIPSPRSKCLEFPAQSRTHTCDVCAKSTPNVLILCDDCDPTVDGKVAGRGSGVERIQAELDAARAELDAAKAEIERLKGTPDANGIKPCPFCGCPGELHGIGAEVFVRCKCCDAHGEWVGTKDAAIRQWNRRGGE